ncbi:MAG: type IV pilus twitching motility protein PilT [bacterium]
MATEILSIDQLLKIAIERNASDLHITAGLPPMLRIDGRLVPTEFPRLKPEDTRRLIYAILNDKQREKFERDLELDTSYGIAGYGRFRLNVFKQRGAVGAAFRSIPNIIKTPQELGLPDIVNELAKKRSGLILVTGPTGVGKSTTLAAIIDIINSTRSEHILTIEDPIEFIHTHKKSMINQRELGIDTYSFANALRSALREDPDVILVGEMRDLETISGVLTAAETGHLVLSTLHTIDAPQTIDRIIDVFPTHQQQQVRIQLAGVLESIISQQLIPSATGSGRVLACEVLVANAAVKNIIREGKVHQLKAIMQTNRQIGMQTMDQALYDLWKENKITVEEAISRSSNPQEMKARVGAKE